MHGWRIIQTVQLPIRGVVGVEKSNVRRGFSWGRVKCEVRKVHFGEGVNWRLPGSRFF